MADNLTKARNLTSGSEAASLPRSMSAVFRESGQRGFFENLWKGGRPPVDFGDLWGERKHWEGRDMVSKADKPGLNSENDSENGGAGAQEKEADAPEDALRAGNETQLQQALDKMTPEARAVIENGLNSMLGEPLKDKDGNDTRFSFDDFSRDPQRVMEEYLAKTDPQTRRLFEERMDALAASDGGETEDLAHDKSHSAYAFAAVAIGAGEAGRVFAYLRRDDSDSALAGGSIKDRESSSERLLREQQKQMLLDTLAGINQRIAAIDQRLDYIDGRLGDIDVNIENNNKRIAEIDMRQQELDTEAAGLTQQQTEIDREQKELEQRGDQLDKAIGKLENKDRQLVQQQEQTQQEQKQAQQELQNAKEKQKQAEAVVAREEAESGVKVFGFKLPFTGGASEEAKAAKEQADATVAAARERKQLSEERQREIELERQRIRTEGAELRQERKDNADKYKHNKKRLEEISERQKEIQNEKGLLASEKAAREKENQQLEAEKKQLLTEQSQLQQKRKDLVTERDELRDKVKALNKEQGIESRPDREGWHRHQAEKRQLVNELKELQGDRSRLQEKRSELIKERDALKDGSKVPESKAQQELAAPQGDTGRQRSAISPYARAEGSGELGGKSFNPAARGEVRELPVAPPAPAPEPSEKQEFAF